MLIKFVHFTFICAFILFSIEQKFCNSNTQVFFFKGPVPPWQQTPPPPAAAAPYAPPVGYGVPPRGVMYPQMGQPPPMPPWVSLVVFSSNVPH